MACAAWRACAGRGKAGLRHARRGRLRSLAYLDPGTLESDVQNGSLTGFIRMWSRSPSRRPGVGLAALQPVASTSSARATRLHAPARLPPYLLWGATTRFSKLKLSLIILQHH